MHPELGTRVDQEPDVRVTENRVVLGQLGDVRRVSNPSSATVADVDPALGLDVPPFWWGDYTPKVLVGRLFRWTTEGQRGSGDIGVALASKGFVSPPGSLVMSPLPHGTSEGVDADRCAFDQFEKVSLAAHWTRLRPSGPRCFADQPAQHRRERSRSGTSVTLPIAGETSSTRSTFGNGLVEQQDLLLVGRLENRCPLLKVSPCHGRGCPLARRIATFSSLDQLLQGRIEVMQFDSHPQSSRPESFLIPFNSRPMAPLQNHALAPGEEILGKIPQLTFETHSEFVIPQIGAQLSRPPVLIQPDGGILGAS